MVLPAFLLCDGALQLRVFNTHVHVDFIFMSTTVDTGFRTCVVTCERPGIAAAGTLIPRDPSPAQNRVIAGVYFQARRVRQW